MSLVEVKDLQIQDPGLGQIVGYNMNLITDSGTYVMLRVLPYVAFTAGKLKEGKTESTVLHPSYLARKKCLPIGSVSSVDINPISFETDEESLNYCKQYARPSANVLVLGHNHNVPVPETEVTFSDGSTEDMICAGTGIGSAVIHGAKLLYKSSPVKKIRSAGNNLIVVETDADDLFTSSGNDGFLLVSGYDMKTGKSVNNKYPDGRYTAEGLINELSAYDREGVKVEIKEARVDQINELGTYLGTVDIEKNGKKESKLIIPSNSLLLKYLFNIPVFIEDSIFEKVDVPSVKSLN